MASILVIDFGSQVTQLIARAIRESGVYCEIHPCTAGFKNLHRVAEKIGAGGVIFSGGPASTGDLEALGIDERILDFSIPILGICYGQQLICSLLGGEVESDEYREFGRASLDIIKNSPIFDGFDKASKQVWMSHSDRVTRLPKGFEAIARTESAPYAAIANEERKIYGFQFHPEVTHTGRGRELIRNFIYQICEIKPEWNMRDFLGEEVKKIKSEIGDKGVICAVSGGVDSTVTATILHRAIGDNLHCVFVDNGLGRLGEVEFVRGVFESLGVELKVIQASEEFLEDLDGVTSDGITDSEQKRKLIGNRFIRIFEREAKNLQDIEFLGQGTLYPDVIESPTLGGVSSGIKSHHNVGGLPEKMGLKLIEPLRGLFKDEVRVLGEELGIERDFLYRHPFPGPGLAVRVIGKVTKEKLDILRQADKIFIDELKQANLYDKIWQAFCVLPSVKTVGVMGDNRSYEYVCALRAVTSIDGMTADFYKFNLDFLGKLTNKIINEVKGINRVVYDTTSKPPGTIEWE